MHKTLYLYNIKILKFEFYKIKYREYNTFELRIIICNIK